MGIGFVLLFYLVVLSIAAGVSSLVLAAATSWYLRTASAGRGRLTTYMAVFPFACVVYAGAWFIAYAAINDIVFHHDPMIGDGWYTDIGNGYAIDMIDVTDQGVVHPVNGPEHGLNSPEGLTGVRRLQVAGTHIFGSQDVHGFEHLGQDSDEESNFFAIDMPTHHIASFHSENDLAEFAKRTGVTLKLQPIESIYRRFRMNWFEPIAGLALVLPPALAFATLGRQVFKRKRHTAVLKA
jgi:4-amino-4-deoxy-L-arabinose transferase-like glycosyltransferase